MHQAWLLLPERHDAVRQQVLQGRRRVRRCVARHLRLPVGHDALWVGPQPAVLPGRHGVPQRLPAAAQHRRQALLIVS